MRVRKAGDSPTIEMWDVSEIMNYLNCDEMKARKIMDDYHQENGGYGPVEKALILDYIERKQREEREREARYQSDIANAESIAVLKEQVKALKESFKSSSEDAKKARIRADISNVIALCALIVAILALILK